MLSKKTATSAERHMFSCSKVLAQLNSAGLQLTLKAMNQTCSWNTATAQCLMIDQQLYLCETQKHRFIWHLCRVKDHCVILKFSILSGQLMNSHFTLLKSLWKAVSLAGLNVFVSFQALLFCCLLYMVSGKGHFPFFILLFLCSWDTLGVGCGVKMRNSLHSTCLVSMNVPYN